MSDPINGGLRTPYKKFIDKDTNPSAPPNPKTTDGSPFFREVASASSSAPSAPSAPPEELMPMKPAVHLIQGNKIPTGIKNVSSIDLIHGDILNEKAANYYSNIKNKLNKDEYITIFKTIKTPRRKGDTNYDVFYKYNTPNSRAECMLALQAAKLSLLNAKEGNESPDHAMFVIDQFILNLKISPNERLHLFKILPEWK